MSETRGILRNTGILGAARLIERAGNLVVAFFISRHGGAAALGTYATAMAYFQLIATMGEMGWTNLLIREISRDRSRTNNYLLHAGVMATLLSAAGMAIAWVVIPRLGYSDELRLGLLVVVLAILPGVLNTVQEAVFVAHQRVEFETLTTLGSTVVTVVLSAMLLSHGYGVVSLIVVFVVTEYAATLVYFFLIHRRISPIRLQWSTAVARHLVRELRAFTGSSLLGAAFARPEVIILSLVATEREAGYYIAALKLVELWQFIPQVYMVNVFPVLSRSYHVSDGRAQEIQTRAMTCLLALGLPVSVGLAVGARPIIMTLYGAGFASSVLLLRLLAVAVVLSCMHSVLWRVLAARGEQGRVLRVQVVSLLFRLGGGIALIATIKSLGAAMVLPVSMALHVVLLALAVNRDGTPVGITSSVRPFAASAALMGAVAAVLSISASLPVVVGAGALTYLVGAVVLAGGLSSTAGFRRLSPAAWRSTHE